MDFSKFDKAIDIEGLKKDVEEAKENGSTGDYREVPEGEYEVKVEKLELTESKKGDPMVSVWFKILAGEFTNSMIFMNQVVTQGFQIHIINELLRAFDTEFEIEFESYSQYGQLLMDVHEAIDGKLEYVLNYSKTNKGFPKYEIKEVFEVE